MRISMKMKYKTADGKEHVDVFKVPFEKNQTDGAEYFMKQVCIKNNWTFIKAIQCTYWCYKCGKSTRKGADISVKELDNDIDLTPRNIGGFILCGTCYNQMLSK